ncbi:hypothetical protein QA640_22930 [Bradyrhizobium sp. CB82]|uniref:hypothetical protein n=1 Tax=Bradyrhizobium sp. CB82 TaxID=3039159 RepID=UPI0024B1B025|nr:hypothetical protein [Bradyrhizobium sp. CB82]WFU37348.1 hypothetical protein QA640_22930 [Bradyrhizobium sp. CB82]
MTDSDSSDPETSEMADEQRELRRCKQEIARLKQLIVQLSEIVLRNVVKSDEGRQSERP